MIKRIVTLVIAATFVSAGLLFAGITLMERFSPAMAGSLGPLVAKAGGEVSTGATVSGEIGSSELEVVLDSDPALAAQPPVENQGLPGGWNITTLAASAGVPVSVADLFGTPGQFRDQAVALYGIANHLGGNKVLLNDGTGQILVKVDDDRINLALVNGLPITIVGKLDDDSSANVFKLDACMIAYQDATLIIDDCDDMDDRGDDDNGNGNSNSNGNINGNGNGNSNSNGNGDDDDDNGNGRGDDNGNDDDDDWDDDDWDDDDWDDDDDDDDWDDDDDD